MKIEFELGVIDPRRNRFDHHGGVNDSNAFVLKMSSVQMIEAVIIKNLDVEGLDVEVNHVGHLDDMVMHSISPACRAGKLRTLYAFACRVSALDSLGPTAYALLNRADVDLVSSVYQTYQEAVSQAAEENGVERWKLPLEEKIKCSKKAGIFLVSQLEVDDYEKKKPDAPEEGTYRVEREDNEIWLVKTLGEKFNPIRFSAHFYKMGCRIVVGYKVNNDDPKKYDYSICARSAYDADLIPLWDELRKIENGWGGHSGAGGSPRKDPKKGSEGGSSIDPDKLYEILSGLV